MPVERTPWVGEDYRGVLLVGESHHGTTEEEQDPDFTLKVVGAYVGGGWNQRFFTTIGRILTGQQRHELNRSTIWSQLAFHNYVPALMDGPREAPSSTSEWTAGEPIFRRVLATLEPSHIIVLGDRLWWHMAKQDAARPPLQTARGVWDVREYQTSPGSTAKAIRIHHPSSSVSADDWHPIVRDFLADSRAKF